MFPSPQLINQGPSSISRGMLELSCPRTLEGQQLFYMTRVTGLGNCTASHPPNPQNLEVRGLETGVGGGTMAGEVGEGHRRPGRAKRMCLKLDWKRGRRTTDTSRLWEGKRVLYTLPEISLPYFLRWETSRARLCPTFSGKPSSDLFPWALMPGLKLVYSLATLE